MVKLAVLGRTEFIIGFQLAGIKDTIEVNNNHYNELNNLKNRKDIGIVVVDEKIMENIDLYQRQIIESSVEPVFITVSTKTEQESLRRLIKKSIGVDLLK